jgi:hypothetical protein
MSANTSVLTLGAHVSAAITSDVIALPREAIHPETTTNWENT